MLISDQYEQALRLAALGHRDQVRRGSGVPYLAHPVAVARIIERAGGDESAVIAGLLHDLVEDTATTLDEIRHRFGAAVAATVAGCSEVKLDGQGRPRPWEDRKRDHLDALRSATAATRVVVLADKLHNLISIRLDLAEGRAVWDSFHAPRDRVLWYFAAVIACCAGTDGRWQVLAEACRAELATISAATEENSKSEGAAT